MGSHRGYRDRCSELIGAGRLAEAGDLVDRIIEGDPEDGHAWQSAGPLRHRIGDYEGGRDALLPAVSAGLGRIGEYGAAMAACVELTRRSPTLSEAHFGVASYLRRLSRPAECVPPIVARAHELAPDVPLHWVSLATPLDHVGRREEAREILRDLDLDAVSCRGCLRRMTTIFREGGGSLEARLTASASRGARSPDLPRSHPSHARNGVAGRPPGRASVEWIGGCGTTPRRRIDGPEHPAEDPDT